MAVHGRATIDALTTLQLTRREAQSLLTGAIQNGSATGVPTYAPLSGMLVTVRMVRRDRFEINIH